MVSNSINAIMQMTDRVFLSSYSDVALQASTPAGALSYFFPCILHQTLGYVGTFVAQFHGAGKKLSAARALSQGMWLTLITIPITILLIPVGLYLINHSGHAAEVIDAERVYFTVMMLGATLLPPSAALFGYFTGRGRTKTVLAISIATSIINIILDWAMIYGKLGFPEMGIFGAALATAIAFAIGVVISAILIFRESIFHGKRGRAALAFDKSLSFRIVRYGLPSGLHGLLDMATFTFFVFLTGNSELFDASSFAASNVCFNINHLVFSPLLGVGIGASILIGNYQGAGNSDAAWRAGWSSLKIGWIFMGVLLAVINIFIEPISGLFLADATSFDKESFFKTCRILAIIMTSWCMFDVVNVVGGGALKGAGDTRFVMIVGIITSVFFWIPIVLLAMKFFPSIINLWLTMPAYIILLALLILVRWMRGKWKEIKLVEAHDR